jgi:hypothetical protein
MLHRSDDLVLGIGIEVQQLLLHRAAGQHDHHQDQSVLEHHELHAAHLRRIGLRTQHHGGVTAHPREQLARLVQQVLEGLMRGREEPRHDLAVLEGQGFVVGEVVDEEPVATIGGNPPGRGVGLTEVALPLEHGHLVTDRGTRDAESARTRDRLGTHRLGGLDVFLDHRTQDCGLAVVELITGSHLALDVTECQPVPADVRPRPAAGR